MLPGHHGYQRACDLINPQASTGPTGPPVFARTGKTDPPSRLISLTSAGKSYRSDYVIAGPPSFRGAQENDSSLSTIDARGVCRRVDLVRSQEGTTLVARRPTSRPRLSSL